MHQSPECPGYVGSYTKHDIAMPSFKHPYHRFPAAASCPLWRTQNERRSPLHDASAIPPHGKVLHRFYNNAPSGHLVACGTPRDHDISTSLLKPCVARRPTTVFDSGDDTAQGSVMLSPVTFVPNLSKNVPCTPTRHSCTPNNICFVKDKSRNTAGQEQPKHQKSNPGRMSGSGGLTAQLTQRTPFVENPLNPSIMNVPDLAVTKLQTPAYPLRHEEPHHASPGDRLTPCKARLNVTPDTTHDMATRPSAYQPYTPLDPPKRVFARFHSGDIDSKTSQKASSRKEDPQRSTSPFNKPHDTSVLSQFACFARGVVHATRAKVTQALSQSPKKQCTTREPSGTVELEKHVPTSHVPSTFQPSSSSFHSLPDPTYETVALTHPSVVTSYPHRHPKGCWGHDFSSRPLIKSGGMPCLEPKHSHKAKVTPWKQPHLPAAVQLITRVSLPRVPQPKRRISRASCPSPIFRFSSLVTSQVKNTSRLRLRHRPPRCGKRILPKTLELRGSPLVSLAQCTAKCLASTMSHAPQQPKPLERLSCGALQVLPTPDVSKTFCVPWTTEGSLPETQPSTISHDTAYALHLTPPRNHHRSSTSSFGEDESYSHEMLATCHTARTPSSAVLNQKDKIRSFLEDLDHLIRQAKYLDCPWLLQELSSLRVRFKQDYTQESLELASLSSDIHEVLEPKGNNGIAWLFDETAYRALPTQRLDDVVTCATLSEESWFHADYVPSEQKLYDSWLGSETSTKETPKSQMITSSLFESSSSLMSSCHGCSTLPTTLSEPLITDTTARHVQKKEETLFLCDTLQASRLHPKDIQLFTKEMQPVELSSCQSSTSPSFYVLQRGSFSMVCLGLYQGNTVAIKMPLRPQSSQQNSDYHVERFIHEWTLLSCCDHPGIVKLIGAVTLSKQEVWLVLEFINAPDLHTIFYVKQHRLSLHEAVFFSYQLSLVLQYLHGTHDPHGKPSIVHRDIKPENILIDLSNASLHLCDFGDAEESIQANLHCVRGATWLYSPPEFLLHSFSDLTSFNTSNQIFNTHTNLSTSWDIWSAGCVFHEMFGGYHPFKHLIGCHNSSEQTVSQLIAALDEHRFSPQIQNHLPQPVQNIISSCLQLDPSRRPTSSRLVQQWKTLLDEYI